MTRIEKAVKIVSDLYDFCRRIPKVSNQSPARDEKHDQALQRTARERALLSSESPSAHRH
jgi:hypothetical protein